MGSESRKWSMPHRRARSEEVLSKGPPSSLPSMNDDFEPSSPSTPRISEVSSVSSPASTPPKKAWERHYRSFLTKRSSNQNENLPGPPQAPLLPPVGGSARGMNAITAKGKFSLVPGSKRLLARASSDQNAFESSSLSRPRSSGDATVKGGSFFSQVFHKDGATSPIQQQRKIKSMDTLDTTVRRGHEKSYSPRNMRSVSKNDMTCGEPLLPMRSLSEGSQLPNQPSMQQRGMPQSVEPSNSLVWPSELPSSTTPKHTSSAIKKAFTEFHNGPEFAQDSTSAFLGEDASVTGSAYFAMYNQMADQSSVSLGGPSRVRMPRTLSSNSMAFSERSVTASKSFRSLSNSLDPVTEELKILHTSELMLKPVAGPESWSKGRRYLISPAILATCPIQVLPTLSGHAKIDNFEGSVFGVLELGRAMVRYVDHKKEKVGWSSCTFVLRQNYLLEYESGVAGIPRGFAHLQHAKAYRNADFHNALELEFFGSPCAKADKRMLSIRVDNATDRDRWVTCLNDAAQLTVKDLYDFDENQSIGKGRYAAVFKARRSGTGEGPCNCAIKVVDKSEFWRRVVKGMERADTLVREVSVQATLTAKGGEKLLTVVKLRSLFETCDNILFEVELLQGTDLFRHVSSKTMLDEAEAASIAHDIFVSLDAMNRHGVAHRDIKPSNILMCNKEVHGVHVKVADFGMSTFVGVDGKVRGRCGTPGYVAPEIFSAGINGGYGNKVDVFSAGVTLYVMLCGYEPFYGETDAELIEANREAVVDFPAEEWDNVSHEARDLVEAMLLTDPSKRISAKDALNHPWIVKQLKTNAPEIGSSQIFPEGAACIIN